MQISWEAATGQAPISYNLYRNGLLYQSGISLLTYEDMVVPWGSSHTYQVEATDSCANPAPQSGFNVESAPVSPTDATGPGVVSPGATYDGSTAGDCTVNLQAQLNAMCAPATGVVDVLRDPTSPPTTVVATGEALPYADTVPSDNTYYYVIRAGDEAGNSTDSSVLQVTVDNCLAPTCFYRGEFPNPVALPASAFHVPPTAEGLSLDVGAAEVTEECPFQPGDLEPRGAVCGNGMRLTLYQVNESTDTLRLTREGAELRFQF
jgi:hypothetical protein